jgi:hypothetical protein
MDIIDLSGAIDLHVHTHPCLFDRVCDDRTAAFAYAQAGMSGCMIKCHHESTVSRAREVECQVQAQYPGFRVFGGIVLNYYVGGINPQAVEAAVRLGGRCVWMPTTDAENHARAHGGRGVYDVQASGSSGRAAVSGVTVFDSDGKISEATVEVLKVVADYGVILGTSHLSHEEIFALVKAARDAGVKKVLITHPFFKVPMLSVEQLKELVELGATPEFGYCTVSPMWAYASLDKVVGAIKTLGARNCVLMSDAGQRHNPMPPEALRVFCQCLYEKGLTKEEIGLLTCGNPKRLLDL